jgi:hypothetical protein
MRKSKDDLLKELPASFDALIKTADELPVEVFNLSKENKWTPAENIQHLITGTKMTSLAFVLPKFLHVLLYGKPGRTSHGYSKLVDNYEKKLEGGAKASGVYVPKKTDYNKTILKARLKSEGDKLVNALSQKWTDEQLDHYQISHPILGLLTVRELAYFTLYHNGHHLNTIKKYYLPGNT